MIQVGFVLYPQALLSSVVLPAEMLTAADHIARSSRRQRRAIDIRVVALGGAPAKALGGLALRVDGDLDCLAAPDLVLLPALWRNPLGVLSGHRALIGALRQWAAGPTLICAVGTGSWFLAEAGLLDGRPGTTHWKFMETFRHRYPRVETKSRHLITRAGSLYCAASINAVADLTGHFIEHFYGPGIARQVEAHFSPEVRRSYLEHGFFEGESNRHHDELMVDAQQWLREHFAEPIDFTAFASGLGISQRSLNRRFNEACGVSPGRYLQQLRLHHACELLRDSNLSIAAIAAEVGYPDFAYFSALFRARMTQTPTAYRKSVRGKLFDPAQDGT